MTLTAREKEKGAKEQAANFQVDLQG